MTTPDPTEAAILGLTASCGPHRSISPEDAARLLAGDGDWRALLPAVRRAAVTLAGAGRIDILRKGKPVDPAAARGVIRLRSRSCP